MTQEQEQRKDAVSRDQEPDQQRTELQDLFDRTLLDNGYIMRFTFDLFENRLTILVRVPITQNDVREHRVEFRGVRALFYQNELDFPWEDVAAGYDPAVGTPWSWAGYNYYDRPVTIRLVDPPSGLKQVGITVNFALDVFNGVVLIAASGVSIDDEYFDVGLPPMPEPT